MGDTIADINKNNQASEDLYQGDIALTECVFFFDFVFAFCFCSLVFAESRSRL